LLRFLRRRHTFAKSRAQRVIIIGFDGMDPEIAEAMLTAGRLPNLAKLRETGCYRRLATTCPAMSPVAWSSFTTGTGPGRHGIFDFLHRDPKTYLPDLSSAEIRPPRRMLKLGKLQLPLSRPIIRLLRRSKPFWKVLGEHGIFSNVIRVPITFPPEKFYGVSVSGMCVPDLRGSQGSFTFFTTAEQGKGGVIGGLRLPLQKQGNGYLGTLPGPEKFGDLLEKNAQLPFRLFRNGTSARLEIGGERLKLVVGEFTPWTALSFSLGPGMKANGMGLFYLKQLDPEIELYVSPINIDPEKAALPVTHPAAYSIYLSKKLGRFATLGLAEDTWALNEGALDDGAFLRQCQLFCREREAMLANALDNLRQGCLVCVFDTTDRVQHMFWRYRVEDHPAPIEARERFREAVEDSYRQADEIIGRVTPRLGKKDVLLVMSDHGFKVFRRGINLNSWFLQNGYMQLKPGATGEGEWLRDVDWAATRAYAVGLGGVYLNIKGREAQGIVPPGEAEALKKELIAKLSGLRDEEKNAVGIAKAFDTAEVNPGPYAEIGPDLTIGYAVGYRSSWDCAQGKAAGPVFTDNTKRWSGDHCLEPSLVPGVLFCSQPLADLPARIMDVAPTMLNLFGVAVPGYMQGRSLLPEK
jgi:predicted AlkP superfamily phosphohydrolase/phosphomutase